MRGGGLDGKWEVQTGIRLRTRGDLGPAYLFDLDGREKTLEHCTHQSELRHVGCIGRLLESI